ncbi:MAG: zinc ribbon domain-containing protein [Clostridiales bacterium]|nr:zinc ribbon domain-containing protein [Clostridiales bacterium]
MAKISKERKVTYYIGMGLIVIGSILFISTFIEFAHFMRDPFSGGFSSGDSVIDTYTFRHHLHLGTGPSFARPVIGIVLVIGGIFLMNVGARGAAGSGLILDPDKAREDLKPFNEAKGGMVNDVISNIDLVDKITKPRDEKEVVKIRCKACGSLNDEDSNYCKGCGREV